jgi:hypothetical protein
VSQKKKSSFCWINLFFFFHARSCVILYYWQLVGVFLFLGTRALTGVFCFYFGGTGREGLKGGGSMELCRTLVRGWAPQPPTFFEVKSKRGGSPKVSQWA